MAFILLSGFYLQIKKVQEKQPGNMWDYSNYLRATIDYCYNMQ